MGFLSATARMMRETTMTIEAATTATMGTRSSRKDSPLDPRVPAVPPIPPDTPPAERKDTAMASAHEALNLLRSTAVESPEM